jgi:hypothetical protein
MENQLKTQRKLAKTAREENTIGADTICKKIDNWYGAVSGSTGEKPVSDNTATTEFRPNRVVATVRGLSKIRGIGAENGINEKRMYGLAFDFAAENEAKFREFVKQEVN